MGLSFVIALNEWHVTCGNEFAHKLNIGLL